MEIFIIKGALKMPLEFFINGLFTLAQGTKCNILGIPEGLGKTLHIIIDQFINILMEVIKLEVVNDDSSLVDGFYRSQSPLH